MKKSRLPSLHIGIILTVCFLAWPSPAIRAGGAASSPVPVIPADADAEHLLQEGVALHDAGQYDAAIAKYREALAIDPKNQVVHYELANTLYAKKELHAALEVALAGRKLPGLAGLSLTVLAASIYDDLDQPEKALALYDEALQEKNEDYMLHFNRGITLSRLHRLDEARFAFERAVLLNPNHASSHLHLGRIYQESGYRFPATLAFARFLVIEPDTPRAQAVRKMLLAVYENSANIAPNRKKKGDQDLTIYIDPHPKTDEGNFADADLGMGMLRGLGFMLNDSSGKSPPDSGANGCVIWNIGFASAIDGKHWPKPGTGFARNYYLPYFIALDAEGLSEALGDVLCPAAAAGEAPQTGALKSAGVQRLLAWSAQRQWPGALPIGGRATAAGGK